MAIKYGIEAADLVGMAGAATLHQAHNAGWEDAQTLMENNRSPESVRKLARIARMLASSELEREYARAMNDAAWEELWELTGMEVES